MSPRRTDGQRKPAMLLRLQQDCKNDNKRELDESKRTVNKEIASHFKKYWLKRIILYLRLLLAE